MDLTIVALVALLAMPVILVLGVLAALGSMVCALADGIPNGLVRSNPS